MERNRIRSLQYFGAVLVLISVAVHLWWGLPRFLIYANPQTLNFYLQTGGFPDPRPFLFLGLVLVVLVLGIAVWRGLIENQTVYIAMIVLMMGSVVGWALWHTVLNHGVVLTSSNAAATEGHEGTILGTLLTHFITVPLEGGTKLVEIIAVLVFGLLVRADPRPAEAKH